MQQPAQPPFRSTESYTSLLLGVCVVIIGILFFVSIAKMQNTKQVTSTATSIIPTIQSSDVTGEVTGGITESPTQQPTIVPTKEPTKIVTPEVTKQPQQVISGKQQTYTVATGDDLWHIAEKFYKSGYNYVDIAKANNLENPGILYSGTKLIIPQVTPDVATATIIPTQTSAPAQILANQKNTITTNQTIKTNTYVIQQGDDLWDIAVRAYNDGYKWTEIAKANNLTNPGLIHTGNVIKIPR